MQVPMMRRSAVNMEYYMEKEPGGSFVALDRGKIVGSIVSHAWGSVGWFGPLEVNPVCQGRGYGRALVEKSLGYLRSRGCATIGCETMAGSPRNIAFYHRQGFGARALSHVLYKRLMEIPPENVAGTQGIRPMGQEDIPGFKKLWDSVQSGLDYSVEIACASVHGLGQVHVMDTAGGPAHALVHTYEMFDDSQNAIIKLLVASDTGAAERLLDRCEVTAAMAGKTGMFIRTYDASPPRLGWFLERGYALQGTSVRFILEGPDEATDNIHVSCWSG